MHGPFSDILPGPADRGKDLYWRWMEYLDEDIAGRGVTVVTRADGGDEESALAACRELIEDEGVFLVAAYPGTPPSADCARFAASHGVPYVSLGAGRAGFRKQETYFATSMTAAAQIKLLADMFESEFEASRSQNAIVYWKERSVLATLFASALAKGGAALPHRHEVSTRAGGAEFQQIASEMKENGVDNVFYFAGEFQFLTLTDRANTIGYFPRWAGIGMTVYQDATVEGSCSGGSSIEGAQFFSPYPAVNDSLQFDPDFGRAMDQFHPTEQADETLWHGWAMARTLRAMLELPGRRLTEARFVELLEDGTPIGTGIGPRLKFGPSDRFGARSVHVIEASCATGRWHTARKFVRRF